MHAFTKKLMGDASKRVLDDVTISDFSGGWNVLDDDLNLGRKFSVKSANVFFNVDQTMAVRYGTTLFAYPAALCTGPAYIVNAEYFGIAIVCVMSTGEIVGVFANGTMTKMFDNTIAAALPNTPAGWTPLTYASFEHFNGELIIVNGQDKPLIVRTNLNVEYLHDEGTGSNINTPIAKYVTTVSRYLLMAGDPLFPHRVHISARNTSGTFFGDPAPNDATFIDIGANLSNASAIRGIKGFRGRVIATYPEGTVIGTLGTYDGSGAHLPNFDDSVAEYGCVSHRTLVSYGDDMLMMDTIGVPSLKRTVFTGTIRPERVSDLVDPEMQTKLKVLTTLGQDEGTFGIYNRNEGQFMFFIPNASTPAATTETKCYCFTFRPTLSIAAWARFDGWNFTCGVRSAEGNIFFGDKNGKLWLHGNAIAPSYSDYLGDATINNNAGIPINFDWELPWATFGARNKSKTIKYIGMDTRGTAEFTAKLYVDRITTDNTDADSPLLQMNFVGGTTGFFGQGDQPYGGGRNTSNEALYAWPAKCNLAKMRFTGSLTEPLRFVAFSLWYYRGGYNR